jgi:hypothetical protein
MGMPRGPQGQRLSACKDAAAVALGRKGGCARAEGLSAKRRKEIARTAARVRWGSSTNAGRSVTVRATRYWLRNDTYVDLTVPYQKIGVPFDSTELASALTNDEKTKVITELSKCEPAIRDGNLHLLELALEICRRCQLAAPVCLLPHALEAINRLLKLSSRTRQTMMQREIHQIRWATVYHLRVSQGLTWDAAYQAASEELFHTHARGSEETIRASYKWMNLHPFIKSMRQYGLAAEIDAFAREQYENRQDTSRRLIALDTRHTPPKRARTRSPNKTA